MGEIFKSPIPCDPSKIPRNLSLPDYCFQQLEKVIDKVADKPWLYDVTSGKHVNFGDVKRHATNVASALARKGFGHGDLLYFVTYDIVDMGVLQMAVWMLGGVTRGSFQLETPDEFARQIKEVRCKFLAVDSATAPLIKEALALCDFECKLIAVGDSVEGAIDYADMVKDDGSAFPAEVKISPERDWAVICNTSGSTGIPKGVVHSHFTFVCVLACFEGQLVSSLSESQMLTASNFAISSSWTYSAQLCTGTTLYAMSRYRKEEFIGHLLKHKPTSVFLYPYIAGWFARCPEIAEHDFSFLKRIMLGGSVIDPTTMQLLQAQFPGAYVNQAYASTEGMGTTTTLNSERFSFPLYNKTPDGDLMVSSGFPFPLVKLKITDLETGDLLGRNKLGRLHIQSPHTMLGYFVKDSSELDRSDFDAEDWFNTGDVAFVDDSGQLFVRERVSFMFKYYMYFVNPSEVEAVLQEHPSVQLSCVVGVPDLEATNLAKALVVLKQGKEATAEELLALVAQKLPFYKHLYGGLQFVESLPENKGRKLDRVAIKQMYAKKN